LPKRLSGKSQMASAVFRSAMGVGASRLRNFPGRWRLKRLLAQPNSAAERQRRRIPSDRYGVSQPVITSVRSRRAHTEGPARRTERLQNHLHGSAIHDRPRAGLEICLMPENETPPIVRVVFACTACTAPFEARQILQPESSGTFTCGFCGDEVHSWSGSYDYADWRSVRRPRHRAAWSWETSSIQQDQAVGTRHQS